MQQELNTKKATQPPLKYAIVMAAYNEENHIGFTLESIAKQTIKPIKLIIVDDNSNDRTFEIAKTFEAKHQWATVYKKPSNKSEHSPGSKVVEAFNFGYKQLNTKHDLITKLDADLILPTNYFEHLISFFDSDPQLGLAGGVAYIKKQSNWVLENLTNLDHVRGAFKTYRATCFNQINGLKPAMGWDTVDELLCLYYNWKIKIDKNLIIKHLKPTGFNYNKSARLKQGKSFYRLGYGFLITLIASLKLAYKKRKFKLLFDYIQGYLKAKKNNIPLLVTKDQAIFIRKYRISNIKKNILLKLKSFFSF